MFPEDKRLIAGFSPRFIPKSEWQTKARDHLPQPSDWAVQH